MTLQGGSHGNKSPIRQILPDILGQGFSRSGEGGLRGQAGNSKFITPANVSLFINKF